MGEPISETAHYVVVRGGGTDLYLIQEGRLEASGVVPILWDRGAERDGVRPAAAAPAGPLGVARRRAVRFFASVFNLLLLTLLI
jgi:hypothetical protein